MTNQACRLQRLGAVNLAGDGTEGRVQFLNAAHGTDLRKLRGQFVVLHWVRGILILKLRHQQGQKAALQIGGIASRQGAGIRRTFGVVNTRVRRIIHIYGDGHACLLYWPRVSVLSIMLFTVLSTSTFAW